MMVEVCSWSFRRPAFDFHIECNQFHYFTRSSLTRTPRNFAFLSVFKSAKHFWDDNKVSQSRNTSVRYTMSSKIHKQNGNLIWTSRIRGDNVNQLFSLSTTRWKPSQSQCDKEKKIFKPSAIESLSSTERQCCGKLWTGLKAYSEHVAGRRMYCGFVEWCEVEFTSQEQQKKSRDHHAGTAVLRVHQAGVCERVIEIESSPKYFWGCSERALSQPSFERSPKKIFWSEEAWSAFTLN